MENYFRDDEDKRREEIKRFYNQIKSTRAECQDGARNCERCTVEDCKIKSYVEMK